MASPLGSISEVAKQNPSKRGLAVIVTNDYQGVRGLETLTGPSKDGARMKRVLESLQIATVWKENVTRDQLWQLLHEVQALPLLPRTYDSISFVFSGHGMEGDLLVMQEGQTVHLQGVVNSLLPRQARNIGAIPKLFFIDACRGSGTFQPVVVPRSGVAVQVDRLQTSGTRDRGGNDMKTLFVPPEGNVIIAYSNVQGQRALERSRNGGIWMQALAKKLAESRESIDTVLTEVREELHHMYQDPQWQMHMQLPETVSYLLRPVYLHPEAAPCKPALQPGNISPPGPFLTQRDKDHPGHYRARFLHLQQTGVIKDVTKCYEGNFVQKVTFVKCANGCEYTFRSEKEFSSKPEAEESAAKLAVLSLELGARGSPPQPTAQQKKPSPPQPQRKVTGGAAPQAVGASNSPTKDPKSRLKEHCDRSKLPQPQYESVESGDASHKAKVTVLNKTFFGDLKTTKKEAEKSAAEKALAKLKI